MFSLYHHTVFVVVVVYSDLFSRGRYSAGDDFTRLCHAGDDIARLYIARLCDALPDPANIHGHDGKDNASKSTINAGS